MLRRHAVLAAVTSVIFCAFPTLAWGQDQGETPREATATGDPVAPLEGGRSESEIIPSEGISTGDEAIPGGEDGAPPPAQAPAPTAEPAAEITVPDEPVAVFEPPPAVDAPLDPIVPGDAAIPPHPPTVEPEVAPEPIATPTAENGSRGPQRVPPTTLDVFAQVADLALAGGSLTDDLQGRAGPPGRAERSSATPWHPLPAPVPQSQTPPVAFVGGASGSAAAAFSFALFALFSAFLMLARPRLGEAVSHRLPRPLTPLLVTRLQPPG
jgi:hypothetical protein